MRINQIRMLYIMSGCLLTLIGLLSFLPLFWMPSSSHHQEVEQQRQRQRQRQQRPFWEQRPVEQHATSLLLFNQTTTTNTITVITDGIETTKASSISSISKQALASASSASASASSVPSIAELKETYESTTAVVMLAFGNVTTETRIVERCLYTLRHCGTFTGLVLLITDNVHAVREHHIATNDPNFIIVPALPHHLQPRRSGNPDGTGRSLIKFHIQPMIWKRFKTYVLDYLDSMLPSPSKFDKIQTVLYMDVDVVTIRPLYNSFLHEYYAKMKEQNELLLSMTASNSGTNSNSTSFVSYMSMFLDNAHFGMHHNTGIIVLDRHLSRDCLDEFRAWFDSKHKKGATRDQRFTRLMLRFSKTCQLRYLPKPHIVFPSTDEELLAVQQKVLSWTTTTTTDDTDGNTGVTKAAKEASTATSPTFVHITNSWHSTLLTEKVQEDFYRLLLQNYHEDVAHIGHY